MSSGRAAEYLRALPAVLKNDGVMRALAETVAVELHVLAGQTLEPILYARIDELPEALLDLLADDFKVDWYDYSYSLEEKRRTLKESWNVHRHLGTKFAVKTAISAVYHNTQVKEWWEYGGPPYSFKLILDATYEGVSPQKHKRVMELVSYYKNLRSHLEAVEYTVSTHGSAVAYVDAAACCTRLAVGTSVCAYGFVPKHLAAHAAAPVRTDCLTCGAYMSVQAVLSAGSFTPRHITVRRAAGLRADALTGGVCASVAATLKAGDCLPEPASLSPQETCQ